MQMPWRPCGCYGTVLNDGNRHKPTEKSLPDGRSIRFPIPLPLVVTRIADFPFTYRPPRF